MTRSLWRQFLTISGDQQISNQWRRKKKASVCSTIEKISCKFTVHTTNHNPNQLLFFSPQYSTFCMCYPMYHACETQVLVYFKVWVFNMTFIQYKPTFFHCQKFSQGFREPSRKYFSPGTSHKISRVCYFINLHLDNEKQALKTSLPPVCHKRQLLRKIVGLLHSTP